MIFKKTKSRRYYNTTHTGVANWLKFKVFILLTQAKLMAYNTKNLIVKVFMYYITSNDGTKIAVYDYNPQGKETVFFHSRLAPFPPNL